MALTRTNKQVKLKFDKTASSSASSTTSNGDIIFDKLNKKIYARGVEFNCNPPSKKVWTDIN